MYCVNVLTIQIHLFTQCMSEINPNTCRAPMISLCAFHLSDLVTRLYILFSCNFSLALDFDIYFYLMHIFYLFTNICTPRLLSGLSCGFIIFVRVLHGNLIIELP